ncbi:TPA: FaeA/PapI family transcriptional regulator [Escherichia coli]|nr:FaeA/PapI family transcriptional regulator [Escherichia coli]
MREDILFFIQNATPPCRTYEIFQHFGLSAYQARYYLQCLEKEGKIRRTPPRRGARTLWETARQIY